MPSTASSPIVSPGWSATRVHASTTPGMKLARSYDGAAQHVTGLVSSTTDGLTALGQLSNAVTVQMSASTSQEMQIPISTALILPAGKYTMTGVVNNLTSAATIIVNKARCWVSN